VSKSLLACSLAELSVLIERKEVSPVELTEAYFDRIEAMNGSINAFIRTFKSEASDAARRLEAEVLRGRWRGRLHGIPIGVKDLFDVANAEVTAGSRVLAGRQALSDSVAAKLLRDAGSIVLGILNMDEFAFEALGMNPFYGDVHNPWMLSRSSGGSSGGSGAAVAASLCVAALGTDTGGSVRIPASLCGVVGLKPTYDLISREGVVPLAPSLDHVGILARSVTDSGIVLQALAGPGNGLDIDFLEPSWELSSLEGVRCAVPTTYPFDAATPAVAALFTRALATLERAGAVIVEVDAPEAAGSWKLNATMEVVEAAVYHQRYLDSDRVKYGSRVLDLLGAGERVPATDYVRCLIGQRLVRDELTRILDGVDVLLLPTTPIAAPPIGSLTVECRDGDEDVNEALAWMVCPFNQAGLPAISVPCGFTDEGLPVGLQVAGHPLGELDVLRVAKFFERETNEEWKVTFA
jgi:aspartyl-tRNA(Asn)/glutamyl-tRNA(Gln) amidotransferase subunit A